MRHGESLRQMLAELLTLPGSSIETQRELLQRLRQGADGEAGAENGIAAPPGLLRDRSAFGGESCLRTCGARLSPLLSSRDARFSRRGGRRLFDRAGRGVVRRLGRLDRRDGHHGVRSDEGIRSAGSEGCFGPG